MYTICVEVEGRRVNGRNRPTLSAAQRLALQWVYALRETFQGIPYPVVILDTHGNVVETHG